jgi:hypothetical protein
MSTDLVTALLASGPRFTTWDLFVIAAFLLDMVVGPLSALLLVIALAMRRGGWPRLMFSVAAINVALAGLLLLEDHGEPLLTALLAVQAIVAVAVMGIVRHPPTCARIFGGPPQPGPR